MVIAFEVRYPSIHHISGSVFMGIQARSRRWWWYVISEIGMPQSGSEPKFGPTFDDCAEPDLWSGSAFGKGAKSENHIEPSSNRTFCELLSQPFCFALRTLGPDTNNHVTTATITSKNLLVIGGTDSSQTHRCTITVCGRPAFSIVTVSSLSVRFGNVVPMV
jgi:hypothetical protein